MQLNYRFDYSAKTNAIRPLRCPRIKRTYAERFILKISFIETVAWKIKPINTGM